MQFTKVYAYGFRGKELESISVSPVCNFIETLLEMTLDNMDMLRSVAESSTYKEHSTPGDIALTIELCSEEPYYSLQNILRFSW